MVGYYLGNLSGPLVGSLLYEAFGFMWAFLAFGVILFSFKIVISYILPDYINNDTVEVEAETDLEDSTSQESTFEVAYSDLLALPRILTVLFFIFMLNISWYFWESILSLHLTSEGYDIIYVTLYFAIGVVAMGFGTYHSGHCCVNMDRVKFAFIGLLICSSGSLLMSQSKAVE
jgi:MFS family permease